MLIQDRRRAFPFPIKLKLAISYFSVLEIESDFVTLQPHISLLALSFPFEMFLIQTVISVTQTTKIKHEIKLNERLQVEDKPKM